MNYKVFLLVALLVGIVAIAGCARSNQGYATYNPQQGGQQQPYVGGGCGVAPVDNLGDSPASIGSASNLL